MGFVNIDPMAYDDPAGGKPLLHWRSGFEPIKVRELACDGLSFAPGSAPIDLVDVVKIDACRPRTKPVEDINSRRVLLIGKLFWHNDWPVFSNCK